MNFPQLNRLKPFKAALCYGLFLAVMILTIKAKSNYHMDEISSYGLANHVGGINLTFEQNVKYTPAEAPFHDYLTVSAAGRFNYENVIANQELDVHPPLYYLILHTICSIEAGKFSKWYAASINFIFALLTLFVLRKLVGELTNNGRRPTTPRRSTMPKQPTNPGQPSTARQSSAATRSKDSRRTTTGQPSRTGTRPKYSDLLRTVISLFFILSPGILSIVSFLRMYVMAMFWVTTVTWLLISEIGKWRFGLRFWAGFFLITVLGALTHYYCIIYTVLLCTVYCIVLLAGRRWRATLGFIITSALAGFAAYALFPAMTIHMFEGYRGKEALGNLQNTASEFFIRILQYLQVLNVEIYGNMLGVVLAGAIFLIVLRFRRRFAPKSTPARRTSSKSQRSALKRAELQRTIALKQAVILITCALYFLFVAKAAAYVNARYISPIYAVVVASVFCLVGKMIRNCLGRRIAAPVLGAMVCLMLAGGWMSNSWEYLYRDSASVQHMASVREHADADCLFIYSDKYKIQGSYEEIRNYRSVTFVNSKHLKRLPGLEIAEDFAGGTANKTANDVAKDFADETANVIAENKGLIVLVCTNKQGLINAIEKEAVQKAFPRLNAYVELGKHNYSTTLWFYETP